MYIVSRFVKEGTVGNRNLYTHTLFAIRGQCSGSSMVKEWPIMQLSDGKTSSNIIIMCCNYDITLYVMNLPNQQHVCEFLWPTVQ